MTDVRQRPGAPGVSWNESSHDRTVVDASEITTLLGADSEDANGGAHDGHPRKDSWAGYADFEGVPWWNKPSVWWLLFPYALFTLALGGSMVPKLNLIIALICKRYFTDRSAADPAFAFQPVIPGGNNPQCTETPEVLRLVAAFTMVLNILIGILSSLSAPKLGALSDRYGRKHMMALCSAGGVVSEIITIAAATYPESIHYNWLIFGAFFDGLTGSFTAGTVLSHAYAADCTPPSKRSVAIGYLHSCLFTSLAFGPLLAGYFVEWTGSLLSIFYVTLGCHIFFIFVMLFVTPESLSRKRQLIAREKHATEQAALAPAPEWSPSGIPGGKYLGKVIHSVRTANPLAPLTILFPKGPGTKRLRRNLLVLALIDTAILGAGMSSGTVIILYTEKVFHWGNFESSRFLSLVSTVRVFVLMGIFPVINYIFRTRPAARRRRESGVALVEKNAGADDLDVWIMRTALMSDVVGMIGYIFVRTSPLFVLCAIIAAFGGLGSATIQASLSKHVPAEQVGQLLGAIGLLHSLARVVAPMLFNGLFALTVSTFPQAFFVLLASIFMVATLASFFVRPHVYMTEDEVPGSNADPDRGSNHARQSALEDDELVPS
ncbi:major facilitator superfamily domain-containing protein [Lasiosphaeria hispida]|uniref:Major facilitator superfamily domain-containing protein n=1 Tax=Lasiosphaeria hispida TaxID=260671 RepID=A0AAJ0MEC6_9PEZI|nr:major facilitator superfamily domain-containing protein [Lasiosphaeria hispida]